MTVTTIELIHPGVVRNLLKTPYYLRIPADPERRDRIGKKIVIPATQDVEIDYRDWKLVEFDLITKDRMNILRIIKYPESTIKYSGLIVINNYPDLPDNPVAGTIVWVQYGPYQGIFYWDDVRNEWLSENEMLHTWNSAADVNTHTLNLMHHTNDTQTDNDVDVSIPLTITGMAASQVNPIAAGNTTRFAVNTFDLATGIKTPEVAFIDLNVVGARGASSTTLNSPIDAGFVLSASRIKLAGTDKITRPAATLWYRWRLVP
jgi:hypothetical protein